MMELRVMFVVFGCLLMVVHGQEQCHGGRECVPIEDCPEFGSYVGKTWPLLVQNEVKALLCGIEQSEGRKIFKVCCKPKTGLALLDLKECGIDNWSRLANGRSAQLFEYPWMALLGGTSGAFHCGGSLIAERFVLTAAHCNLNEVKFVRVGELDLSTPKDCNYFSNELTCAEPHQDIPVEQFIKHHNYSVRTRKNDIALVKLVRPAKLNDNVRPICLPLPQMTPQKLPTTMRVAGWGYSRASTEISNGIRFAQVPIVELQQCKDSLRQFAGNHTVDESEVCTGVADYCPGDSGGPLQYPGNNRIVIHGITSWGLSFCGGAPDVYTSVPYFIDWIIENLK